MTILANLLKKRKVAFSVLFLLLSFQLLYSFLYPTHGPGGKAWLSFPEVISHQKSPLNASENSLVIKAYGIFTKYYVNTDGGQYILLANNFPKYYLEGQPVILDRPLYSFLIAAVAFLPRLIFDSFATVFVSAIFLNFILGFFSVALFYYLCKKLINSRVALLSSLLLISSPFFHVWLVQPIPEILTIFIIIATLFFLENYIKNPSRPKLIIFSLIIGTFMLGKMFFAISFFILTLAFYFKRYKEGALFLAIHLMPLALWYFWVTQVFGLEYYVNEAEFGAVVWLFKIFSRPWYQTVQVFLDTIPKFVSAVIYGFLLFPVIFALIGFKRLLLKNKEIFCLSLIFSFLALSFISNFYIPRHAFHLFPMIYPLAILGIDRVADFLKRYKKWYAPAFYILIYSIIIFISSLNIYKFVDYS